MIESVRKAFVTLRVFQVNHTGTIFRCGNLGNVEIFETSQALMAVQCPPFPRGAHATYRQVRSRGLSPLNACVCTISRTFRHRKTVRADKLMVSVKGRYGEH